MSTIHYFQRYSHSENVATNNTLLLLSRLYQHAPNKFDGFLSDLLEDSDLKSGIQFIQQMKGKGSVPDGSISQVSFKIIIETKLHKNFSISQLTEHLNSFGDEDNQILLSLSPSLPDKSKQEKLQKEISEYNIARDATIKYIATTFQDIVTKYNNCLGDYDYQLQEIVDDYEAYCIHDRLIVDDEARMRVVTCGWTLQENFQFNLYYEPVARGSSPHNYIGIYKNKSVRGIGKIENIVIAVLNDGNLKITESTKYVTELQMDNIIGAISSAKKNHNWNIANGHKFYCVDNFFKTDFRKTTKYPLQGTRLFNLKKELQLEKLPSTEEIANRLKNIQWE